MSTEGMEEFEAQFADDYIIADNDEITHMFWALSQAMDFLDAEWVVEILRDEFPWFAMMTADPAGFRMAMPMDTDAETAAFMDALGEWVKRAGALMVEHVDEHGLPGAHLPVYMPCHHGWAHLRFNVAEGRSYLDVPEQRRPQPPDGD